MLDVLSSTGESDVRSRKTIAGYQQRRRNKTPQGAVKNVDSVERIEKVYTFKDFNAALSFTNQVGALAEQEDHHPALLTEWGQVTVTWWSHKLGGLHRNDLIMAARTDQLD